MLIFRPERKPKKGSAVPSSPFAFNLVSPHDLSQRATPQASRISFRQEFFPPPDLSPVQIGLRENPVPAVLFRDPSDFAKNSVSPSPLYERTSKKRSSTDPPRNFVNDARDLVPTSAETDAQFFFQLARIALARLLSLLDLPPGIPISGAWRCRVSWQGRSGSLPDERRNDSFHVYLERLDCRGARLLVLQRLLTSCAQYSTSARSVGTERRGKGCRVELSRDLSHKNGNYNLCFVSSEHDR